MSDFSFLAVPNIGGMRLGWYIQIFGIVVFFGVCLFFVLYFRHIYHTRQSIRRQSEIFDQHAQDLAQQLLRQKIRNASGKNKLILFIEYVEKFTTTAPYANLGELLTLQGFDQKEVGELSEVSYTDKKLSRKLEEKLQSIIDAY